LRNFNKQQLILAKFYVNNAPSIGNQSTKFQLNLLKQTVVTVVFVRSPQKTTVSDFCGCRQTQRPETDSDLTCLLHALEGYFFSDTVYIYTYKSKQLLLNGKSADKKSFCSTTVVELR